MRTKSYQSLPIQFITYHMGLFLCIYDILCIHTLTHIYVYTCTHTDGLSQMLVLLKLKNYDQDST